MRNLERLRKKDPVVVNFNQLSKWGLVQEIDNLLGPLGLKCVVKDGSLVGAEISPNLYFEKSTDRNVDYERFIINRYYELTRNYNTAFLVKV